MAELADLDRSPDIVAGTRRRGDAARTEFTLFGYPGLAILLFLAATAGGLVLLVIIMWGDR